jgi:hypothetical protein
MMGMLSLSITGTTQGALARALRWATTAVSPLPSSTKVPGG